MLFRPVSAAERVGPGGYVLATDIAEGIVALALQVARERGLKQIEVRAVPVPLTTASSAEYVWNEVEDSMRSFESSGRFEVPGECLVGAATK